MKNATFSLAILAATLIIAVPAVAGPNEADIVDVATDAGSFTTLVTAVQAAGLVDALKADGPFTVFAPNDEAFAKLPQGTVESLLKPENIEQLKSILTYHVIPGKVMADNVTDGASVGTLQGQSLDFAIADGSVMVGSATVISADVGASNGVIHVIDTVLLPATR